MISKEITWNIVNSLLAGGLVFFGGCASGDITWKVIGASALAAALAAIIQFKKYWETEEHEYSDNRQTLFTFV